MDIVDSIKSILYIDLPPPRKWQEQKRHNLYFSPILSALHEGIKFQNYFLMSVFTTKLARELIPLVLCFGKFIQNWIADAKCQRMLKDEDKDIVYKEI